jgi:molecular chaperone DnaK
LVEVDEAVKGDDVEKIEEATKKLTEASSGLAQKMYAEQAAQAGAAGDEQSQAGGDDVVDAEFEEVKDDDKK